MPKIFRSRREKSVQAATDESRDRPSNPKTIDRRVATRSDNPIDREEDDALGRASAAHSFARQVLDLDAAEGIVVGVLGPWGSGKTSFVNLTKSQFEQAGAGVLEFNPWMFSGAEQLVDSFFIELGAQLKVRGDVGSLGTELQEYGEALSGFGWVPFVGTWVDRGGGAMKLLAKILEGRKEGIGARRAKLKKALMNLHIPIVVFLDDVDRLSTPEIRDVFKLVRLTASFPNLIYIVAFDRLRVEQALAEQGVAGRAYLEKILQIAIDLPVVPDQVLGRQVLTALDGALDGIENKGPLDEQRWPDVFAEVVRPLIRNMRDVRRYAASVRGTVTSLEGQIALDDVLALEGVRIFLPDVFSHLHSAVDALTTTSPIFRGPGGEPSTLKAQIEGLIEASQTQKKIVRAMINRLFPAAQRHIGGSHYTDEWKGKWLRNRRVAHEDILRLYLERVVGEGLQNFAAGEKAWAHLADRSSLESYFNSLDKETWRDTVSSLETYEDQFAQQHVIPGTIVLLNLLPDLPERETSMLDFGSRFAVLRVTYRLLRTLRDSGQVESAVRQILPELSSLRAKHELIRQIGHVKDAGHRLVSEDAAEAFEKSWRAEVRACCVGRLVQERDLVRLLIRTKRDADPSEPQLTLDSSPELTLAVLQTARADVLKQTLGNRAVTREPQLAWDVLLDLYSDEATLRTRIESLRAVQPKGADELLQLAARYLEGWRPGRFGE